MAREVRWARRALDALDSAVAYLSERDPDAAERLVEEINRVVAELSRRNTGRPGRVKGTFERSIPKWRYIIVFEIVASPQAGETLVILHVVHTSRNWPKGGWPK